MQVGKKFLETLHASTCGFVVFEDFTLEDERSSG
jgi:hypothetical protein